MMKVKVFGWDIDRENASGVYRGMKARKLSVNPGPFSSLPVRTGIECATHDHLRPLRRCVGTAGRVTSLDIFIFILMSVVKFLIKRKFTEFTQSWINNNRK